MRGSRRALRSPSGRRVFGDSAAGRDPGCEDWVGPWPCPRPGHSLGQPPVLWGPSGGVWMCASGGGCITHPHTRRDTHVHICACRRGTQGHTSVYTPMCTHRNAEPTHTHVCTEMHAHTEEPLCTHPSCTHPSCTHGHRGRPHGSEQPHACQPRLRPGRWRPSLAMRMKCQRPSGKSHVTLCAT